MPEKNLLELEQYDCLYPVEKKTSAFLFSLKHLIVGDKCFHDIH